MFTFEIAPNYNLNNKTNFHHIENKFMTIFFFFWRGGNHLIYPITVNFLKPPTQKNEKCMHYYLCV